MRRRNFMSSIVGVGMLPSLLKKKTEEPNPTPNKEMYAFIMIDGRQTQYFMNKGGDIYADIEWGWMLIDSGLMTEELFQGLEFKYKFGAKLPITAIKKK